MIGIQFMFGDVIYVASNTLSDIEIKRYSRQIILPNFSITNQKKLKAAKILVTGAGGIGTPALCYLAATGVGNITIIDSDNIEYSNLHRQFLFNESDVGKSKCKTIAGRLRAFNPNIDITPIETRITYGNAFDLLRGYDAILDGTDNFPARYAVNDAAVQNNIPLFHAAALQYEGRAFTILPQKSACLRCIFPEPPPPQDRLSCREAGVLSPAIGIAASIAAAEAAKYLAGLPVALTNKLVVFDSRTFDFRTLEISRDENCTACGKKFIPKPVPETENCHIG